MNFFSRIVADKLGRQKRVLLWGLGISVLCVVTIGMEFAPQFSTELSNLVFDRYQQIKPRKEAGAPIVIVDIDAASLREIGQWPWPRTKMAKMVNRLGRLGAAAIAFDMVFSEPDRTSPSRVVAALRKDGAQIRLPAGERNLDNDVVLAHAFSHNPVVAGIALTDANRTRLPSPKAGFAFGGVNPKKYLLSYHGGVRNLPVLSKQATGIGFFSFPLSGDGVVRALPLVAVDQGHLYPALSIEALRVAQRAHSFIIRSTGASGSENTGRPAMVALQDGAFDIPTGPEGQFRVYYSLLPHVRTISAATLLRGVLTHRLRQEVRGHIVLIGSSAVGLRDIVATPLGVPMPGVRVHANIIDQIMGQTFLTLPDWAHGAAVVLAVILGVILLFVEQWTGALLSSVVAVVLIALTFALSWTAFSRWQLLLDPILPAVSIIGIFVTTMPALLLFSNREKRFIQSAFGRYLSPKLVDRLTNNPQELRLGGELRELTVLFSDIRNFTTLSERLDPEALTRLLNDFLTPTTSVLLNAEATIDKYIGDAIMAFWNAPLPIDDHARKACLAALRMQEVLDDLNRTTQSDLKIGIGLHSGSCCVGNLGSVQRFNYSAIGDSVNLASRVEGLTKQYGVDILVTEATKAGAPDLAFIEVDRVRVLGRKTPVTIYALLGGSDVQSTESFIQLSNVQQRFLDAYRRVDLNEASVRLEEVARAAPEGVQAMCDLYSARLSEMRRHTPEPGWDGVYLARDK